MSGDLLQTKLYTPRLRPSLVPRPRLIEILNQGLAGKLTLISAPAGFGKTTLVSSWIDALQTESEDSSPMPIAWLSLDENDGAPALFFSYIIAALQRVDPHIGESALPLLQASPLPLSSVLTTLLNDIAAQPDPLMLMLDDYHVVEARPIDEALAFLLDHLPPQLHLVITTREDPNLPLARLRARGLLTELRAADLRFTVAETAVFLRQAMGLDLTEGQIAALEARTEGWIAGLQMAALSMRGQEDVSGFIRSFTGSHRFVLDYLMEEVLHQQPAHVQAFLLKTAVLNRLTGSLCDALTGEKNGQEILESLERANLFLVPLDNERHWYRYHHLFAELLRQISPSSEETHERGLHIRASQWYEANGLELEAFHHAAAANDVDRAVRLIEGDGVPLHFRGAVIPVLNWLASLPKPVLDTRPLLWVTYASVLLFVGQNTIVEPKLEAAEAAIAEAVGADAEPDDDMRDLIGRIATMRATIAIARNDLDAIIEQSHRARSYLHPDNVPYRTAVNWTLGYAYQVQGDRKAASQTYNEIIATAEAFGDSIYLIAAFTSLGQIQESDLQLSPAASSYRRVLQLAGEPPQPIACEAHLGLARLHYQWNDLDAAQQHGQKSLQLVQQIESIDTFVSYKVFQARLLLAHGDVSAADAVIQEAEAYVRQHDFMFRMADVAAVQVIVLLHQGKLAAATGLAQTYDLPLSRARVHLAQGDPGKALAVLEPASQEAEDKRWADERFEVLTLQAMAYWAQGEKNTAVERLAEALALAKPGGFIRLFVDEGVSMARLLYEALARDIEPTYVRRLLAAFPVADTKQAPSLPLPESEADFVEPLSERELEVLQLIAEGLTNQEVANRLYLSLHTVKVHARNIYAKLDVRNRTEAVAKGRSLGILSPT